MGFPILGQLDYCLKIVSQCLSGSLKGLNRVCISDLIVLKEKTSVAEQRVLHSTCTLLLHWDRISVALLGACGPQLLTFWSVDLVAAAWLPCYSSLSYCLLSSPFLLAFSFLPARSSGLAVDAPAPRPRSSRAGTPLHPLQVTKSNVATDSDSSVQGQGSAMQSCINCPSEQCAGLVLRTVVLEKPGNSKMPLVSEPQHRCKLNGSAWLPPPRLCVHNVAISSSDSFTPP